MAGWELAAGTPINGQGTLIAPMQGARVLLSTVPVGFGLRTGDPALYYDLGYVVWRVGSLSTRPRLLQLADELLVDAPRGATGLTWSLLPGVSGTVYAAYYVAGGALDAARLAPAGATAAEGGWMVLG